MIQLLWGTAVGTRREDRRSSASKSPGDDSPRSLRRRVRRPPLVEPLPLLRKRATATNAGVGVASLGCSRLGPPRSVPSPGCADRSPEAPHEAGPSSPVQDADGGCREKDHSGYQQDRDDRRVSRPACVGGDDQRDDQKCDRRAAPQDGPYWAELLHAMHPAGGAESVVETTWISRSMPARGAVALGYKR